MSYFILFKEMEFLNQSTVLFPPGVQIGNPFPNVVLPSREAEREWFAILKILMTQE